MEKYKPDRRFSNTNTHSSTGSMPPFFFSLLVTHSTSPRSLSFSCNGTQSGFSAQTTVMSYDKERGGRLAQLEGVRRMEWQNEKSTVVETISTLTTWGELLHLGLMCNCSSSKYSFTLEYLFTVQGCRGHLHLNVSINYILGVSLISFGHTLHPDSLPSCLSR